MYIDELYNKLNNGECFIFSEKSIINFSCSQCNKNLLEVSFSEGKTTYNSTQGYLYYDGDTLFLPKEYNLKVDTGMMFGSCENCRKQIAVIHAALLDRDIDNKDLKNKFKDSFSIFCEDDLISNFKQAKQYLISLDNIIIGKVAIYKKATLNKGCSQHFRQNPR